MEYGTNFAERELKLMKKRKKEKRKVLV